VAAVNPWMLRMTGEVADGVQVHPLASQAIWRDMFPEVAEGAAKSGDRCLTDRVIVPGNDDRPVQSDEEPPQRGVSSFRASIDFHLRRRRNYGRTKTRSSGIRPASKGRRRVSGRSRRPVNFKGNGGPITYEQHVATFPPSRP